MVDTFALDRHFRSNWLMSSHLLVKQSTFLRRFECSTRRVVTECPGTETGSALTVAVLHVVKI